jgi:hypothetical protein
MLLGIYCLAIAAIKNGKDLLGALLFAVLLNFKHIFAYSAPVFFVYLLKNYCFELKQKRFNDYGQFFRSRIPVFLRRDLMSFRVSQMEL